MKNINFVMDMTKSFLDGEIDCTNYYLDFTYEIEMHYQKMACEDRECAELIFDYLVEEGAYKYDELSDDQFSNLIRKQYDCIKDIINGAGC